MSKLGEEGSRKDVMDHLGDKYHSGRFTSKARGRIWERRLKTLPKAKNKGAKLIISKPDKPKKDMGVGTGLADAVGKIYRKPQSKEKLAAIKAKRADNPNKSKAKFKSLSPTLMKASLKKKRVGLTGKAKIPPVGSSGPYKKRGGLDAETERLKAELRAVDPKSTKTHYGKGDGGKGLKASMKYRKIKAAKQEAYDKKNYVSPPETESQAYKRKKAEKGYWVKEKGKPRRFVKGQKIGIFGK